MKYPKPVCDYIAAHASECSMREMAERVNRAFGTAFTEGKIKSFLRNHGLRNGRPNGVPHGYSKLFPKDVQSYIIGNYRGVGPREMALRVNERFGTAYGDAVLRCVGERVRDMVRGEGGIVCRRVPPAL